MNENEETTTEDERDEGSLTVTVRDRDELTFRLVEAFTDIAPDRLAQAIFEWGMLEISKGNLDSLNAFNPEFGPKDSPALLQYQERLSLLGKALYHERWGKAEMKKYRKECEQASMEGREAPLPPSLRKEMLLASSDSDEPSNPKGDSESERLRMAPYWGEDNFTPPTGTGETANTRNE